MEILTGAGRKRRRTKGRERGLTHYFKQATYQRCPEHQSLARSKLQVLFLAPELGKSNAPHFLSSMVYVEARHTPCQSTSLHLSLGFPIPLGSTINRRNADSPAPFSTLADAPLRWSQLPQRRLRLLTMSSEHRALNALCLLSAPRLPTAETGSPCLPRFPGSRAPVQTHSRTGRHLHPDPSRALCLPA